MSTPTRLLIGVLISLALFAHALGEEGGCARYVPEIGKTVRVPCGDSPALSPPRAAGVPQRAPSERVLLGLTLVSLTPELRRKYTVEESIVGVLVTGVVAQSVATDRGIKPGDVIVKVGPDQRLVATPEDMARIVESATASGYKSILLLVNAAGTPRFVALPLS